MTGGKRYSRKFSQLTTPEQIVSLFQHKVSEGYRATIELTLKLDGDQFAAAWPQARDIGIDGIDPMTGGPVFTKKGRVLGPIYLTPVYDRPGWLTARPTEYIVAKAQFETRKRNLGEALREQRLYSPGAFGANIAHAAHGSAGNLTAQRALVETLPEMSQIPEADPIVRAIDLQVTKTPTKLYVPR